MQSHQFEEEPLPDTEDFEGVLEENFDEPLAEPAVPVVKPDYRAKDLELFNVWNNDKTPANLGKLVKHLAPILTSEVNRISGTLPKSALMGEAKNQTVKAIKTFDPSRGVALSTHVMNYLPKLRRMNYKYQNNARLPEPMQIEYGSYKRGVANLSDELNRDPTPKELAKALGWSEGKVLRFKNRSYEDLIESSAQRSAQMTEFSDRGLLFSTLMDRLSPEEKTILELKGSMSAPDLAKKLGVNTNRLNYLQRKLVEKIANLQKEIGL